MHLNRFVEWVNSMELKRGSGVELPSEVHKCFLGQQQFFRFFVIGVIYAAIDRADSRALGLVVKPDAFGAFFVRDVVDIQVARVVFTLGIDHARSGVFTVALNPVPSANCQPLPLIDGVVGTFRFTGTAVDAIVGNHNGHACTVLGCSVKFGAKIRTKMTNTLHSGLVQLGAWFRGEIENEGPDNEALLRSAEAQNRWFTNAFVKDAMKAMARCCGWRCWKNGWVIILTRASARTQADWLVLAGNLPMVGWHDVLCVLLTGHHAIVKCSSEDQLLIPAAIAALDSFSDEDVASRVEFVTGTLNDADAVIATGSKYQPVF